MSQSELPTQKENPIPEPYSEDVGAAVVKQLLEDYLGPFLEEQAEFLRQQAARDKQQEVRDTNLVKLLQNALDQAMANDADIRRAQATADEALAIAKGNAAQIAAINRKLG